MTSAPSASWNRNRFFSSLRGLTTRGYALLAAGISVALASNLYGLTDLLRIAVLLVALPVLSIVVVAIGFVRFDSTRVIAPFRTIPNRPVTVQLTITNQRSVPAAALPAHDTVPPSLTSSPWWLLPILRGKTAVTTSYETTPTRRGIYQVGPLTVRMTDPLGLCERPHQIPGTNPLIVHPVAEILQQSPGGGLNSGNLDNQEQASLTGSERDLITREYRHGDDLRRVHWKSTARRGELMVRREQDPPQAYATLVLDTRPCSQGHDPCSSLEWIVTAGASIAMHLANQQYHMRLRSNGAATGWWSAREIPTLALDYLAAVQLGEPRSLAQAVESLQAETASGLVIALLRDAPGPELESLHRPGSRAYALFVHETVEAHGTMELPGWNIARCTTKDTVAAAWAHLTSSTPQQGQVTT